MSDTTISSRSSRPFANLLRTELKLFLREPLAVFWGLLFPLVLLIVIGTATSGKPDRAFGGLRFIDAYVPVLVVFVLTILSLNAVPAVLTSYRDKGYLRRLSTTPVGAPRLLGAQFALNVVLAASAVLVMVMVARVAFDVALPSQPAGFVLAVTIAAIAMLALGALVSAVAPNQRLAGLIGSLLTFPMMFFAGLWVPRQQMGATLRHMGDFTPLGAASGAVQDSLRGHWPHPLHLAVLAAYAVIFIVAAAKLFRWDR